MKKNITVVMAVAILVYVSTGFSCSFTTANISKLDFAKNEKGEPATTTFDMADKIFAIATISNTSSKHKINFKLTYDNVAGKKAGEEALSKDSDFEGARPVWLSFNVPAPGTYKVEATLSDEDGKKIDSKTGTVTVKGSAPTAPAADDKKKTEEEDEE